MDESPKRGYLWFKASIVLGVLLGLVLLFQSVWTYRLVAGSMVRIEARRESDRRLQSIIRASRPSEKRDTTTLLAVMDELVKESPQQIAWMRILDTTGTQIVTTGHSAAAPVYAPGSFDKIVEDRNRIAPEYKTPSGPVLVTLNPLFVGLPANGHGLARTMPGVGIIEIAIYLNGVSARFGPLRENLIVGVSAACALLAAVVIIAFRFRNYLRGKQVEEQLAMARLVQFDLLPPGKLETPSLEFAAQCVPAWQVGGDFYDAFDADDHQFALILGDVSGKGLSAALLMGVVQGSVHASTNIGAAWHEESAERLNQLLCMKTARERFVSLVWCYYDPVTSVLGYINAGHLAPLLIRKTASGKFDVQHLTEGGPVLGVLPGARFKQARLHIEPGDLLIIYSDGILEATDAKDDEFGEERILQAIEENWTGSPLEIRDAIFANVRTFLGGKPPHDDQTLMVVRLQPAVPAVERADFRPAEQPLQLT